MLDSFSGCGGNLIQFGIYNQQAYGCEIDKQKVDYARHNCSVYQVNNTKVINKDYLTIKPSDVDHTPLTQVFMSPPWGGVGYMKVDSYKLDYIYPHFDDIMDVTLPLTPNIILYLP